APCRSSSPTSWPSPSSSPGRPRSPGSPTSSCSSPRWHSACGAARRPPWALSRSMAPACATSCRAAGGALESWDGVAPALAERRRVLRYDTRGAGMSTKARSPLSMDTMVGDLAGLLDALGITGKVAVVGIAVGGAIALAAALRLPHRIRAAVVTSPAIGIAAERRPAVLARVDAIEREGMRVAVDDSMANGYPAELRRDPDRFSAFRARWLGNDPASYAAIYRMLAGLELGKEIAAIACPVLVIAGSLDRVRPPALVEPVARLIPAARYQVLES